MDWNKKVYPSDLLKAIIPSFKLPSFDLSWAKGMLDKWQGKLKGKVEIDPKPVEPTRYNRPIRTANVSSSGSSQSRALRYPCKSCDIKDDCEEACELIHMDDDTLKDKFLENNCCPDCGSDRFVEGPRGGAAVNVFCRGCGHYFNFGLPLFIHRISVSNGKWQRGFMG